MNRVLKVRSSQAAKAFAKIVEARLAERGQSSTWLARKIGLNPVNICRLANGEKAVNLAVFIMVCSALELDPALTILKIAITSDPGAIKPTDPQPKPSPKGKCL